MVVHAKVAASGDPPLLARKSSPLHVLHAAVTAAAHSSGLGFLKDHLSSEVFIDPSCLRTGRALGQGASGQTHRAELALEGGASGGQGRSPCGARGSTREVAVKTLRRELLEDPEQVLLFVHEVELLRTLRHRNIVEFVGCSWNRSSLDNSVRAGAGAGGVKSVYFVQEFCAGGSLGDLIRRQMIRPYKQLFSDADALRWCLGAAHALQYLHSLDPCPVMHRDLKLDNLMLSCADLAHAEVKLGDFGLARLTLVEMKRHQEEMEACQKLQCQHSTALPSPDGASGDSKLEGSAASSEMSSKASAELAASIRPGAAAYGTPRRFAAAVEPTGRTGSFGYMAPEVLRSQQYNAQADIFSLGMCMHNLFARVLPSFQILLTGGVEQLEQYAALVADGFRPALPEGLPPALADVICDCWKGDPALRPDAATVVQRLEAIRDSGVLQSAPVGTQAAGCCAVM